MSNMISTDYELGRSGIESRGWGARFSTPVQTSPGAHAASCTMGTRSFPGLNNSRGVRLTPHHFLVPWSWKGRALPLLPLWAERHVQRLSACTRVLFTFFTLRMIYTLYVMSVWNYTTCGRLEFSPVSSVNGKRKTYSGDNVSNK
jgi:hypothetical protein